MPALEAQVALNDSADQANKAYVDSLLKKARSGVKLRPEEIEALVDFRANANRKIELADLAQRSAAGEKLSKQEIDRLLELKTNITAKPFKLESVPATYREDSIESVTQGDTRKLTAQDKAFAKQLGKIGPISNVQLSETPGDTPLVRLANKIYGPEGWRFSERGDLEVKPKGQVEFLPLPAEGGLSTIQRTGVTAATSLTGELLGTPGGIAGVAAGAGIGGGVGENINIQNAIKDGEKLGLFTGEERKAFGRAVRDATVTGTALGAVFGGGLPLVKGVSKGLGKGGLKAIDQAIRAEDKSIAQAGINQMRKFAVGGKDFDKLRANINLETLSDRLLTEFSNIPEGTAGRISRESVDAFLNKVKQDSDVLFDRANQSVLDDISKGREVGLYDVTELYNDLEKKLLREASENDRGEVMKFLGDLKKELNFTKKQVVSGEIPSRGFARNQFSGVVFKEEALDPTLFGPGQTQTFSNRALTDTFDPTQVTARDFSKTKSFIKDELTALENPKYILGKKTKKDITQWLQAFEQPFAQAQGSDALDVAIKSGIDEKDLVKGNPFKNSKIKITGNTKPFKDVTDAYKIKRDGFKTLSTDARKVVQGSVSDTDLESRLLNADPTLAKQVKGVIDNFTDIDDKALFRSSMKARVFNPPGSAKKSQIDSIVNQEASPAARQQAQSAEKLQEQGIIPSRSLLKSAQESTDEPITKTVLNADTVASDLDSRSSNARIFLGEGADTAKKEAQRLAKLKRDAGLQSQAGKTEQTQGLPTSTISNLANPQGKGLVGGIISETLNAASSVARPLAAPAATSAEALKRATIVPAATIPNVGGYVVRNQPFDTDEETRRRGFLESLLGGFQ